MTLYRQDPIRGGGQTGVHSHLPAIVPASLRDKLTDRGWEECGTCGGRGEYVVQSSRGPYETDDIVCPDCVEGLVPPEGMVEATAIGLVDAMGHRPIVWEIQNDRWRERRCVEARAALLAAARWEGEQ